MISNSMIKAQLIEFYEQYTKSECKMILKKRFRSKDQQLFL